MNAIFNYEKDLSLWKPPHPSPPPTLSPVKPPSITTCVYCFYFFLKREKIKPPIFRFQFFLCCSYFSKESSASTHESLISESDLLQKSYEKRCFVKENSSKGSDFENLQRTIHFFWEGNNFFFWIFKNCVHVLITSVAEILQTTGKTFGFPGLTHWS